MKNTVALFTLVFLLISSFLVAQEKIDVLLLNKNYKEALVEMDKEIAQNPTAELFLKKGMVFQNQQNYQGALAAFSDGLQYNPNSFELNSEMAESLALLGNNQDAVLFYENAIKIQPADLSIKGKLGRTFINQKKYKQAYDLFAQIYQLDSMNVYWNKQLAFCAFRTLQKEQAIKLYENVLEQNPRDYSTYGNLAILYDRKKEPEKIVNLLEEGLRQFPNDANLYLDLAHFYFASKQYDLAMNNFENFFDAGGDNEFKTLLNFAISCYFAGNEKKKHGSFNALFNHGAQRPVCIIL